MTRISVSRWDAGQITTVRLVLFVFTFFGKSLCLVNLGVDTSIDFGYVQFFFNVSRVHVIS